MRQAPNREHQAWQPEDPQHQDRQYQAWQPEDPQHQDRQYQARQAEDRQQYQADQDPRHQAGRADPSRSRRRWRRRDTRVPVVRHGWVMILGVLCAVLVGLLAYASKRNHVELSSTAGGPLLGSSAASVSQLSELTAAFGHMPVVRVYYPGLPATNAWSSSGKAGANHSAVVVSFKALPGAILSGADDAVLSHFFDTAPTTYPIYYSYYHEPEDNIAAGQFTVADYKKAWAHVVALAAAAHNPQLHSTLILMAYDLDKSSGRQWLAYLPAGGVISTLGWDAYPAGAVADNNPQLTPPDTFMGPAVTASKSVGLPFGFAEFGVEPLPGRAAWLDSVGDYIMHSGAVFGTLFQGANMSDSASISAWRGQVSISIAVAAGPATPTPTGPPPTIYTPTPAPTTSAPGGPSASASPGPSAAPAAGPGISGLTVSPAKLITGGHNHVSIRFTLGQKADVSVSVIAADGTVARHIAKPGRWPGMITISYYGYDGHSHRLPSGQYQIKITATNSSGTSTAEIPLVISGT